MGELLLGGRLDPSWFLLGLGERRLDDAGVGDDIVFLRIVLLGTMVLGHFLGHKTIKVFTFLVEHDEEQIESAKQRVR